jgi:DNA-binding response OmpR family regulator
VRTLIVEDNLIHRLALKELLRELGHEVLDARDGKEALELLAHPEPPAMVILDWMLPELDGLEVCRRVRATPATEGTYLLFLTGRRNTEDVVAALENGADEYLVKPVDPEELRARLKAAARRLAWQENQAQRIRELESVQSSTRTP